MDAFNDLLLACRTGDIETVEALLNTPNLDINRTDKWDYSPLILASICGHYDIVEMLLRRGAICDRDSFEGERCIYGALNNRIRNLLLSFDISKKVDVNQPFASHITAILTNNKFPNKDLVLRSTDGKRYYVNRFLFVSRSPKFRRELNGNWFQEVEIAVDFSSNMLEVLINYVYLKTERLTLEKVNNAIELAKYFELSDLEASINTTTDDMTQKYRSKVMHQNSFTFIEKSRRDMSEFLETVFDLKVTVPLNLEEEIDFEDLDPSAHISRSLKSQLLVSDCIPDIILLIVDVDLEAISYYPCHKCMLIRSEYFDTMFASEIFTTKNQPPVIKESGVLNRPSMKPLELPVISITCTNSQVAELVLSYLYHDDVGYIPLNLTVELLFLADELLLDKLKTQCAVNITSKFINFSFEDLQQLEERSGYDIFELVRASWATRCDKLEHFTSKLIACNLRMIFEDKELLEKLLDLVEESAKRIENRQVTDTIELIDDIRYYLSKKYGVSDDLMKDFIPVGPSLTGKFDEDAQIRKDALLRYLKDLEIVDDMLDKLDLEA